MNRIRTADEARVAVCEICAVFCCCKYRIFECYFSAEFREIDDEDICLEQVKGSALVFGCNPNVDCYHLNNVLVL